MTGLILDSVVLRSDKARTAWLTLNIPATLNAINPAMIDMLAKHLSEIECDNQIVSVVLTGAGRAFCAGADLSFLNALPVHEREIATSNFLRSASKLMSRLEAFPKPVVCALNGLATAGGTELLLCCDLVIAAKCAMIADGHANFGLIPGAGGSIRLPRRVGVSQAKMLFFTGDFATASAMQAAGLVNLVVDADFLDATVSDLCERINAKSPIGLKRMKELASCAFDISLADGLAFEQELNLEHTASYDRNEGLTAFGEGRRPEFLGR